MLGAVKRIVAAGRPAGVLSLDQAVTAQVIEAGATFVAADGDMAALKRGLSERL